MDPRSARSRFHGPAEARPYATVICEQCAGRGQDLGLEAERTATRQMPKHETHRV